MVLGGDINLEALANTLLAVATRNLVAAHLEDQQRLADQLASAETAAALAEDQERRAILRASLAEAAALEAEHRRKAVQEQLERATSLLDARKDRRTAGFSCPRRSLARLPHVEVHRQPGVSRDGGVRVAAPHPRAQQPTTHGVSGKRPAETDPISQPQPTRQREPHQTMIVASPWHGSLLMACQGVRQPFATTSGTTLGPPLAGG